MRVLIVPEVQTREDLDDLVSRLAFYLYPLRDWTITISVGDGLNHRLPERKDDYNVPASMDPRITQLMDDVLPKLNFVSNRPAENLEDEFVRANIILVRDADARHLDPWRSMLAGPEGRQVFPVDPVRDRMEGSQYIQMGFKNSAGTTILKRDCGVKLQWLLRRIGVRQTAYLLGTGPSISEYDRHSFHDGVVIACNTTVLDDALWQDAEPEVLTFADPIFHFGCSKYAGEFRRRVRLRAKDYDFTIVIPSKYYELFTALEPSLATRTIGIPFRQRDINLDLRKEPEVKVIDNIATFLMVPLGATLAKSVAFMGFDGRHSSEQYFWKHNPRTQLHHLMDNIKLIHPGFFDVEYEDYYERHCQNLREYIEYGETLGKRFVSLTKSSIAVLAERGREHRRVAGPYPGVQVSHGVNFRVLALSPDWVDDFGHYGHHDRRLGALVADRGGELISLRNRGMEGLQPDGGLRHYAVFTDSSWHSLSRDSLGCVGAFEEELDDFLTRYAREDSSTPTVIAMYTGTPWHIGAFARLNVKFAGMPWSYGVNLFFMSDVIVRLQEDGSQLEVGLEAVKATQELRKCLDIEMFADTEYLKEGLEAHLGESVGSWPMFSTSFGPDEASALVVRGSGIEGRVRVYAPGTVQFSKGYDLLHGLARTRTQRDRECWDLLVRAVVRPKTPQELLEMVGELRSIEQTVEGVLEHGDYVRALASADVILIPYRLRPFLARTSAVFSDAMLLGKPVVATEGTWAGEWVERLGVGRTFSDGSIEGMLHAIRSVVTDIEAYRARVKEKRAAWVEAHDGTKLVELLRSLATQHKRVTAVNAPRRLLEEVSRNIEKLASPHRVPRS